MPLTRALDSSERDWLRVRSYLQEHRYELAVDAAGEYPRIAKAAGTPLLAPAGWQPDSPIPVQSIGLTLRPQDAAPVPADYLSVANELLPDRADGSRYARYSDVVSELAPPAVFENRRTYRLTSVGLRAGAPHLGFTDGRYFDGIDIGEAAAFEYARMRLDGRSSRLRRLIADPCDLSRRPVNMAITTMTVRHDRTAGTASFLLHWRDPARVGHAGGLYQVIPVGIFQPSGEAAHNERNDFSLWRCMIREFAEELCGRPEDYDNQARPIDYPAWGFARQLGDALDSGQVRAWCLGLGTDPLTYATDLLTVVVLDSEVFDALFSGLARENSEGRLLAAQALNADVIDRFATREPMQAAGAAVLRLAWRHREQLLTAGSC